MRSDPMLAPTAVGEVPEESGSKYWCTSNAKLFAGSTTLPITMLRADNPRMCARVGDPRHENQLRRPFAAKGSDRFIGNGKPVLRLNPPRLIHEAENHRRSAFEGAGKSRAEIRKRRGRHQL